MICLGVVMDDLRRIWIVAFLFAANLDQVGDADRNLLVLFTWCSGWR
jgi:hypothetical protein